MTDEIGPEVIQKTQKVLGKYVKKPPLSEKLLRKPPFRFLHDVVIAVVQETDFLKGLFTLEEFNSENVKEREAKIYFLTKLIDAVKTITKTDLKVRASKIIAGLEVVETNILLQTLGKAIDKNLDSSEYIKQLKSVNSSKAKNDTNKDKDKKNSKVKDAKASEKVKTLEKKSSKDTPQSSERSKQNTPKDNKPKDSSKEKSKVESKTKDRGKSKDKNRNRSSEKHKETGNSKKSPREDTEQEKKTSFETIQEINQEPSDSKQSEANHEGNHQRSSPKSKTNVSSDNKMYDDKIRKSVETSEQNVVRDDSVIESKSNDSKINEDGINKNELIDNPNEKVEADKNIRHSANLIRPKSARPRSGDFKEKSNSSELTFHNTTKHEDSIVNGIAKQQDARPKSSLRPPSVRPSSARPGAPRLRPDSSLPLQEVIPLGKINVIVEDYDKDAEDEETVIIHTSPEIVETFAPVIEVPENNQGHLVEQILEQINESDETLKPKVEIDWEQDGLRGKDAISKEMGQLRTLIQNLTRTANPLGKLLNYLHEDIETMHIELQSWTTSKQQLFLEITKQKKISADLNKPLFAELEHLNQDIAKQEQEITSIRNSILRNDIRIKEFVVK